MEQTDMFKPGLARKTDPQTSYRAAEFISPRVNQLQTIVLDYVMGHRGCTDREMVNALRAQHGGSESTWRTRRSELVDLGLIEPLGEAIINGRRHQTWTAAQNAVR
jgi:hypothetical protein